jgi:hypothetical protein
MADPAPATTWQKWHDELELASKARGYRTWETRAKKIVKRYRDERGDIGASDGATEETNTGARFNILWSNVQTLQPALFAKTPKPVVERRYLDRDDVGRTASVILERALLYELDNGTYQSSLRKAVLDRLLPGRGVIWVRYEPKFTPMPAKTQEADPKEPVTEEVASESAPVDYVDWRDFKTSPSRTWEEVWWIDKTVYMTRKELRARFTKEVEGKSIADLVPLDWSPDKGSGQTTGQQPSTGETDGERRATVHETWDKTERKVTWWAKGYSDHVLDEQDDPLKLEGFWPTPKPLFATQTNDTLVPVPDFYEYQDQASELDELTGRITALTKTIKAAGVYDASIPELQRMFEEGFENKLVPADNMAEFMSKAGASGMGHMWLLPIKDMVAALGELYIAREQVKQSLYEITGISDIVRGAASQGGAKTATEQRIKGQFASMRLNEMQAEVARFARDTLRIMGEVIAEHYDPMTLYLISGYEQYAKEQFPPEPMMGHNGGPPLDPASPPPAGQGAAGGAISAPGMQPMMGPTPEQAARKKAADMFTAAVKLLRDDKLRGFRIDIETDSLIEPDQQATQQARTELLGAISQFLPQAIEAGAAVPETKEAANPKPKPPSPEEVKAQAEMQKQQMETQRMQMQAQIDQQQAQQDFMLEQGKAKLEIEREQMKLQLERERLEMEREKMGLKIQGEQQKAQIQAEAAERNAQIDERAAVRDAEIADRSAERDAEAGEHKVALAKEVAEAKAVQAKKPNGEARA